jgi:hypothetical protein
MARIIAYQSTTPATDDLLLGTQKTTSGTNKTNPTKNFTVDSVVQAGLGYTVYTALLTQTGTGAPVATILKNNTTATLTWARTAGGTYTVTADSNIFTANKTVVFMNYGNPSSDGLPPKWVRTSNTVITVTTQDETAVLDDAVLNGAAFEIRIYS